MYNQRKTPTNKSLMLPPFYEVYVKDNKNRKFYFGWHSIALGLGILKCLFSFLFLSRLFDLKVCDPQF